jgi:hypothetical protein
MQFGSFVVEFKERATGCIHAIIWRLTNCGEAAAKLAARASTAVLMPYTVGLPATGLSMSALHTPAAGEVVQTSAAAAAAGAAGQQT